MIEMKICMDNGVEYLITEGEIIDKVLYYIQDRAIPNHFIEILYHVYVNPQHISCIEFVEYE